ncbi:MAG: acetyl-CoA acetyltransferase [Halobacteriales archaeon]|nr:acetyl-CoA acetyltransferase [Halobacteriales archaeon]
MTMPVNPVMAGVAESDLGETPDRNWLENAAIATMRALDDAGLSKDDVDGVGFAGADDYMPSLVLAEYLGIDLPTHTDGTEIGGSSFEAMVEHAAHAMAQGKTDVTVIAYGSTSKTGEENPYESGQREDHPVNQFTRLAGLFTPPGAYALGARRHMHEYGTTQEQLAEIAVSTREWASMNPKAAQQDPITVEDVLDSRPITDPFNLLDCCLVSDGGGAVVLVSPEKAAELDIVPVSVTGAASTHTHRGDISEMPDLTQTGAAQSGPQAFEEAGITTDDIDVAQIYDSFTYTVLVTLEDLGFCEKGKGGEFVEGGTLGPDGDLPANTQGGGLSYCHPGHFGIFLLIEATRQLRHEYEGDRQVDGAETGIAHGTGGILSSSSTVILERGVN